MKTTLATRLDVALPIDSIPADDSVMPLGRVAPFSETPKLPPLITPRGSVAVKSNVARAPTVKYKGPTVHAVAAVEIGADGGGDDDATVAPDDGLSGVTGEVDNSAVASVSQQPLSKCAQPMAPIASAFLRLILSMDMRSIVAVL